LEVLPCTIIPLGLLVGIGGGGALSKELQEKMNAYNGRLRISPMLTAIYNQLVKIYGVHR
jgi:hypothetical protein